MSQINQVPKGLQDFFGSKSFGRNPNELAQTVIPMVRLEPFYDLDRLRTAQVTGSFNASGQTADIRVPADRTYRLYSLGAYFTNIDASENVQGALRIRLIRDFAAAAVVGYFRGDGSATAGVNNGFAVNWANGIMLPPDTRIELLSTDFQGTQVSYVLSALFSSYRL